MNASLRGIRVACFYPWPPFEPTGAWSRFSCLWRFLLTQGAEVSLALLSKGDDTVLAGLSVRYFGELIAAETTSGAGLARATFPVEESYKKFSKFERELLMRYEKDVYLANPRLGPWLDELIQSHDIVTCEYPMLAPLLSEYCHKWQRPLVVTSHDLLYELHGTHAEAKVRLKERELQALGLADARVYCNDSERALFATSGLDGVTVLNTGDVLGLSLAGVAKPVAVRSLLKLKTPHYCLFVGSSHKPNAEAAREVQLLARQMPELSFILAGSCCAPGADGNITALGVVPDSTLDALYREALVVVVPLRSGTGVSVKTFQAFSYGKPVVSTPVGVRGHKVSDGVELLIAATPAVFPGALRRLLHDEALRLRLGRTARAYAEGLDFRRHFQPYADIICELLGRPKSTAAVESPALILVDNNLCDRVGHHFNYALALRQQCATQGVSFLALVKRGAREDVVKALGAVDVFSVGIHEPSPANPYPPEWGGLRSSYDFLQGGDNFSQELYAGLEQRARPGDVVFLPNATPRQLMGLALLLARWPACRELRYVVMLRYSNFHAIGPTTDRKVHHDKEVAAKYQLTIERLMNLDRQGSIRLATDSHELASEYGAITRHPVEVLPIPHTAEAASPVLPQDIPAKSVGRVRLVFLGDARDEKGFELLPGLLRSCVTNPALAKVEFVVQAFVSSQYHLRMMVVIRELEQLQRPNVTLIKKSLSAESYQALLASADVVLVPYDAVTYRARTSGPFVEAICANKPVVVPGDSWMSRQLADSAAGVPFVSGKADDLARAVLALLLNLPAHTAAASKLGQEFRLYHNPASFVQGLMQTGTGNFVG
jgi:glycosyltransferase involved in cell wall biosynthesis